MTNRPVIIWFRADLRMDDHPALIAAAETGKPVVALYVLDDQQDGRPLGGASLWWLHGSLKSLQDDLARLGVRLILRRGSAASIVPEVAGQTGATSVFWTAGITPTLRVQDTLATDALTAAGVAAKITRSDLLAAPGTLRNGQGTPYKVFTPFWKVLRSAYAPPPPCPAPKAIAAHTGGPTGDRLEDWHLRPENPDWAGGLHDTWTPGEAGAMQHVETFLDGAIKHYPANRDRPDITGTSRLSPHLRFGEISPRRLWHVLSSMAGDTAEPVLRQVGWREFNHHLLAFAPDLHRTPLRPEFSAFPWHDDHTAFRRWCKGQTGFPIVDAGMKELWHTGWMHNRVRMICASFLVKDLLLPWQWGEQWFWDTLVDACPANNPGNWQWVAGCGADAAPYFRVFNPTLQGQKFDPHSTYVKTWVPDAIRSDDLFSQAAKYPLPMVDHGKARLRALEAYASIR